MPRIAEETVRQIADATNIVEVIGAHVRLKRAGSSYVGLCPFHNEKTPSFHVNPARQSYHCFGCGVGGSVFRFLMEYENLEFPAAVRRLAQLANIPIQEQEESPRQRAERARRDQLTALHRDAADWFHRVLMKKSVGQPARDYLKSREIDSEIARNWKLGFAPDSWDMFIDWAREAGYSTGLLLESGLAASRQPDDPSSTVYARFRGRLMFPICNDYGEAIAFSGRIIFPDERTGKYINSPETPLFRKSRTLYGLHKSKRAIIKASKAVICEGQLDLIRCYENGIENVVAPQGTAFTADHARILKNLAEEAILCYDADGAGFEAARKTFEALIQHNVMVRVPTLPDGEDPDSLIRSRGAEEMRALLDRAPEFFDFQIAREGAAADLSSVTGRLRLARIMASTIAAIPDQLTRESAAQKVSTRLGVADAEVLRLVREESTKRRKDARYEVSRAPERPVAAAVNVKSQTVRTLCRILLMDGKAAAWLRGQDPDECLRELPESEPLRLLWDASFDPDDQSAVTAFLSGIAPEFATFFSRLLHGEPLPPDPAAAARDCLESLRRQRLQMRRAAAVSKLRDPNLSRAEAEELLKKEVLDVKSQLKDIPHPPHSARSEPRAE